MRIKLPRLGELSELNFSIGIRSAAISLISIFVPIYLLSLGFTLSSVALFYIATYLTALIFTPVCMLTAARIGLKRMMLSSIPLAVLYYLCLYRMIPDIRAILFVGVINGLSLVLYWIPFHSLFIRYSKYGQRDLSVSVFLSFMKLPAVFCPVIGGVLIHLFGYKLVFLLAIIGIMISVIPLFFTADIKPKIEISIKKLFNIKDWRFSLGFFADGVRYIAYEMLWPVFVFLILRSALSLGVIGTLTGIGSVVFTMIVGWLTDNLSRKHILRAGGVLMAVIWLLRTLVATYAQILLVSITDGFFTVLIDIPFLSIFYDSASERNPDEFIVSREVIVNSGRIFLLLLVCLSPGFSTGFYLVAVTSLVYTFLF